MPSKKKKYNVRFPAGRIKKIMQTDEEVGKVAQAVPIIISRTLELFVHSLLTKTMQITNAKNAKTLSPSHMKQCILSESRFDFLKDLVKGIPDISGIDDEVPTPPATPVPTTACVSLNSHLEMGQMKQEAPAMKIEYRSFNEDQGMVYGDTNSNVNQLTKLVGQVPEFQLSVPTSFQMNQPNFYTEVQPLNITRTNNPRRPGYDSNPPVNIDEDYDT